MPTICDCVVTGKTKASASEKEEIIWRNDMARRHQKWRKQTGWKDRKDVKPVCVELTMPLGRRLNCEVRGRALMRVYGDDCASRLRVCVEGWQRRVLSFHPSEQMSLWWTTLAVWASSMIMVSTGLTVPNSKDASTCATTSSSDPLETRPGHCVGIQSHSFSSVGKILDGEAGRVRR